MVSLKNPKKTILGNMINKINEVDNMENKVALVRENGKIVGFMAAFVDDEGKPIIMGSLDEPIEVIECSRNQLMSGVVSLPQEFLQTIDQNTAYRPPQHLMRRDEESLE